jgi:hypothetical protein
VRKNSATFSGAGAASSILDLFRAGKHVALQIE